jgi:hypothetical protein
MHAVLAAAYDGAGARTVPVRMQRSFLGATVAPAVPVHSPQHAVKKIHNTKQAEQKH